MVTECEGEASCRVLSSPQTQLCLIAMMTSKRSHALQPGMKDLIHEAKTAYRMTDSEALAHLAGLEPGACKRALSTLASEVNVHIHTSGRCLPI